MGRPRKHHRNLPAYVRIRHGSYQYRGKVLCRVVDGEPRMYEELAKHKQAAGVEMVPAAVATFKAEYLKTLSITARKEHARLLDIFAHDFYQFRVDQVTSPHITRAIEYHYGNKPASARHFKARVSTFFRWCIAKKGLLKVNPCREVWVNRPRPKKSPWTDQLFWAIRDLLSPMHQCYHDLSFLLYQRTTDIRRLGRSQIRPDAIFFEPSKTSRVSGAAVYVPITLAIRAVLDRAAEISKEWRVVCGFVVHTRQGTPYTRSGIHTAYRRADEKLHGKNNMVGLNPKALLPYAVTSAKRAGATLEQLKIGRAHRNIATTEGYIQTHDVPVSEVLMELPKRQNFGQPPIVLATDSDC